MAGVTDRPFRTLCKYFGAGHAVSEMMTADKTLRMSKKSLYRANFDGEIAPISAQIAGADPVDLAEAARYQVANGAQIIDINMGCPAKKVCNKLAGSALLQDEDLVARILDSVVAAVDVPVTLKTRLGYLNGHENIMRVALRAEQAGIAALALHGRTREDMYLNTARYSLIRDVKAMLKIPVIANGDIDSPKKAKYVLDYTGADALMIGRAAQGRPWIFREIAHYLKTGEYLAAPHIQEVKQVLLQHLTELYQFYGEYSGCRISRKHIAWYTKGLRSSNEFRQKMYQVESTAAQYQVVENYFNQLLLQGEIMSDVQLDDMA
ncbi:MULTISPECIES: tRNA dihydrouridine synthase DusB [unclassified Acinetobacter]|uniref:tRNA dihydrouridine synthase DusB n=1 Tax=unclassified Acinetobacter TaxID=196816 RepID=UPI0029344DBD|nr:MULTISPECIES: tRNA dihydrouridine synthase DusB [unclassified Acinetobacter]WOE33052.1 tRNA dihydrouridine synthase DusB [Acinetobacter sp. SAAs470]WOE39884.1 tRNA dihydrouridine synthase DusB [Acinetobacter sp. SAAs474]